MLGLELVSINLLQHTVKLTDRIACLTIRQFGKVGTRTGSIKL